MLPRSLREKQSRLKDIHRGLVSALGRTPTEEELADALGVPIDDLHTLLYELDFEQVLSLDHRVPRDEGVFASLGDVLPADPSSAPDTLAIDAEDRRRLAAAIDDLPPVNRQVISLYYHEGLTLKEIGLVLGVSEARVCQIHRKTVGMLKATLASQEAMPCR
jgi:RNA polymerase sigma factor for flagellar operon FliA